MKSTLISLLLPLLAGQCGATVTQTAERVTTDPPTAIIIGELENRTVDVSPPTRLDVNLWNGTLNGVDTFTRCAQMGGTLNHSPHYGAVCRGVDY